MIVQNLHTHSRFCDGKDTPEELVQAAVRLGMDSLGFSGHSPVSWAVGSWANMDVSAYRAEILRLREKYAGRLEIFLGIEQDMDSLPQDGPWDYTIGSVHGIWSGGRYFAVDDTAQTAEDAIRDCFGGDPYAWAEAYYRRVSEIDGCQIVGHFDLLTKFNEGDRLLDESRPRYRKAALEALEALSGRGLIFEINTGAMSRGCRSVPYPSPFLLRAMRERGERICISSDCHDARNLLYAFPQAYELAQACGFREAWVLTGEGFAPQELRL